MGPRLAHKRPVERRHPFAAVLPGVGGKILHRLAHLEWRARWWHRFAETNGDRIRDVARPFPEKAAFFETEDAAPHSIQTDGNDRGIDILHDPLEPASERQQLPDARDLSLG